MDIQTRKLTFIQEFLSIQNEDIIHGLEELLRKWKDELNEKGLEPMSLEQFNDDIDRSLADSKNDRGASVGDIKDEIKKWN